MIRKFLSRCLRNVAEVFVLVPSELWLGKGRKKALLIEREEGLFQGYPHFFLLSSSCFSHFCCTHRIISSMKSSILSVLLSSPPIYHLFFWVCYCCPFHKHVENSRKKLLSWARAAFFFKTFEIHYPRVIKVKLRRCQWRRKDVEEEENEVEEEGGWYCFPPTVAHKDIATDFSRSQKWAHCFWVW